MLPIVDLWLRKEGEGGRRGSNRSGKPCEPQLIIIHRTGNPGSSAKQNRDYFDTETLAEVYASAHYCVDAHHIIQCIPENERAIHCAGVNWKSIGIETCEPLDRLIYLNVLELIVDILLRYKWMPTLEFIQPHSKYDPVNRPYDPFSWREFLAGRASPGKDLWDGKVFYSDLQSLYVHRTGGKSNG